MCTALLYTKRLFSSLSFSFHPPFPGFYLLSARFCQQREGFLYSFQKGFSDYGEMVSAGEKEEKEKEGIQLKRGEMKIVEE